MNYRVRFINPQEHYRRIKPEVDHAITDTLARGDLVLRQQLRDFESHLADFVGVKYAVGVNSCYHALHFALLAAGVGPGDEVITVAHTFVATISAIVHTGATPVMVDVAADYNMDPAAFERAITPRTKAVIPVHLNGRVCVMDRIEAIAAAHKLTVIEDAAQALGASHGGRGAGSFGIGCFSFYPFKSLGGLGDGGALTTNDPEVARVATLLRFNGEDRETGDFHYHGYTALLDNVNAAVLDVKLARLPDWIAHRRATAARYDALLQGVGDVQLPPRDGGTHIDTYQNYVIRTAQRDALRAHLKDAGVETLIHWARPVWTYPGLRLCKPDVPLTERLAAEVLSLPLSAETTAEDVETTAAEIARFFGQAARV